MAEQRPTAVERLIKLAFAIDCVTCTLGAVIAAALAFVIPSTFGWSHHESVLCALYAITILTHIAGAPDGIFRLCDAYRPQALTTGAGGILQTIAVAAAVALDGSFDTCVLVLIVSEVIGNILVVVTALFIARRAGYGGWTKASLIGWRREFPGILRFLLSTSGQLSVKKTQSELDMFVVGSMLGKAASGLLRVIKQLGTIPARIFLPFEQVLFTELARFAAAGDQRGFRRLLRRTVGITGVGSLAVWAVAAVGAEPLIRLVAGSAFLGAVPAFRWYFLAMVLGVANTPVLRAMIALGRPGTLFLFDLATLALLVATTVIGAHLWGLVGVSLALVLHKLIQLAWSTWLVDRALLTRRDLEPAMTPGPG